MRGLMLLRAGCLVAALPFATFADVIYDSKGFETFDEGFIDVYGREGWVGGAFEGGDYPWVWVGPPSKGAKCILFRVYPFDGAASALYRSFGDLLAEGYTQVTVSFDVYRPSQEDQWFSNLWWGLGDQGTPTGGMQWDANAPLTSRTYPLTDSFGNPSDGDSWTDTVIEGWATVELTWDFAAGVASGYYNGELISEKKIVNIESTGDWYFYFSHSGPDEWPRENAWIDNFIITGEKGAPPCYPDCDGNGTLDLFDFLCFVNQFNGAGDYADCDGDGSLNLFDFLCFVNAFNEGC